MRESMEVAMSNSKQLHLLYVEDNAQARKDTTELLSRFFDKITTAEDAEEGLRRFKEGDIDLVLTDINMPGMNGLEMAEEMRRVDSAIVILVLSAHNETDYFISSIKLGIDGFLLKPLEIGQFVETIAKAVEKIRLRKEVEEYRDRLESANRELEAKVEKRTAELVHRLFHDRLTELGNHEAMMHRLEQRSSGYLFLIDIDGFQKYNDLYGLHAGNTILKKFAKYLEECDREGKYVIFRVYGDGFVLYREEEEVSGEGFEVEKAMLLACLRSVRIYLEEIDEEVDVEVSVGASIDADNMFIKADMALQYAKKENRQFVIYSDDIDSSKQLTDDLYWKAEIKSALNRDGIIPVFQAIVDQTGKVTKYEVLMRLVQYEKAEEKLVSPYYFLDAAVNTKQYEKLTRVMIEKSFAMMSTKGVDFSINLSFEDLAHPERVKFLEDKIIRYEVGTRVVIEVLESEMVSDYVLAIKVIERLRRLGVRIAIDDFGSGFSSFEHILQIDPDYIKIDGSIVKNILEDERAFTLVKAIAEFSKELDIKVIAEFVSSKEIYEKLSTVGIDEYQGFYFSIPSKNPNKSIPN